MNSGGRYHRLNTAEDVYIGLVKLHYSQSKIQCTYPYSYDLYKRHGCSDEPSGDGIDNQLGNNVISTMMPQWAVVDKRKTFSPLVCCTMTGQQYRQHH